MARLTWGDTGQRYFETGVDRGAMYLPDGRYAVWNGLVSVSDESVGGEAKPYYQDGEKLMNVSTREEFAATLEALSSPELFGECDGKKAISNGLFATAQPRQPFHFTYRTLVGNDTDGAEHTQKIHLVYNALASPSAYTHTTRSSDGNVEPRSWSITTKPARLAPGVRPTAHYVVDGRYTSKMTMSYLEDFLYGTDGTEPAIPTLPELYEIFATDRYPNVKILLNNELGVWELYQTDGLDGTTASQDLPPTPQSYPVLWLDTSVVPGGGFPHLVTGG